MQTEELKKQIRSIDLGYSAGVKRRSARTGFIHDEETIPLYDNFCFALILFRKKTADSIHLGKELMEKLLPFQTSDGNFPVFLHDYPKAFDFQMRYKVAPILIYLLRLFTPILGELKTKIEIALEKALSKRPEKSSWENRYRACIGEPLLSMDTTHLSPFEWTEWLITAQLAGQTHFFIPYDETLQLFMGQACFDVQEKGEPRPNPIEWLLADGHYTPRLLNDHPHQLLTAPLFPITYTSEKPIDSSFRLFWKGSSTIHSLVGKGLTFDLPAEIEQGRGDLYEAALFCNISPETTILIEGMKGTVFALGDRIQIDTPTLKLELKFELVEGSGEFCGHIFRGNRPSQVSKGYEAYDWQIGLRTLRRQGPARVKVTILQ
jgi:hypothetical protein